MFIKASSTWVAIGVIALAMTAQVFGARGMNTFMADACGPTAVVAAHDDCCDSGETQNATTCSMPVTLAPDSSEREPVPCCPCDGPCDCQTCFRVLLPSPMLASLNAVFDLPDTSSPSAIRLEAMPDWLALSVTVQPPIV